MSYTFEGAGTRLPDGRIVAETHVGPSGSAAWAIIVSGVASEPGADVRWLDRSRCLNASTSHAPTIPVRDDAGEIMESVRTDTPTLLYLSRMLRWTIVDEVRGRYYTASDVAGSTPDPVHAHNALDEIAGMMNGNDWDAALLDNIASVVRMTGRTIEDVA